MSSKIDKNWNSLKRFVACGRFEFEKFVLSCSDEFIVCIGEVFSNIVQATFVLTEEEINFFGEKIRQVHRLSLVRGSKEDRNFILHHPHLTKRGVECALKYLGEYDGLNLAQE